MKTQSYAVWRKRGEHNLWPLFDDYLKDTWTAKELKDLRPDDKQALFEQFCEYMFTQTEHFKAGVRIK